MANEQQNKINADVQEGEPVNSSHTTGVSLALWISLLIVLMISLAASFWLYQQQQQLAEQSQSVWIAMRAEKKQLTDKLNASARQLQQLESVQQQINARINKLQQQQNDAAATLHANWALKEVEFLLNAANQRAVLAEDVDGAKTALKMADETIQKLDDYRLHPLRTIVANELMQLEAVAGGDTAAMAILLQAAANQVDGLRVVKGPQPELAKAITDETTGWESSWKKAAADIWQQVRSLVVIRHQGEGAAAVLVPEQRYFLYQNLKLQIESARLSLFNSDQRGFDHSLDTAIKWLEKYFVGDERDAMLTSLKSLQQQSVQITIPDISGSLRWLEEYQQ